LGQADAGDEAEVFFQQAKAFMEDNEIDGVDRATNCVQLLRAAAELGHVCAMQLLGRVLTIELGLDYRSGVAWLRKAAEQDHIEAMNVLGSALFGLGDVSMARMWYEKAAIRGNVLGMWNFGVFCCSGTGGAVDRERGLRWRAKASEYGDPVTGLTRSASQVAANGGNNPNPSSWAPPSLSTDRQGR
jgi:TPR repeat protein